MRERCHRSMRKNEDAHHIQVFLIVVFRCDCRLCSIPQSSIVVQCVSQSDVNDFMVQNKKLQFCTYFFKAEEGCLRTIKTDKYSVIKLVFIKFFKLYTLTVYTLRA